MNRHFRLDADDKRTAQEDGKNVSIWESRPKTTVNEDLGTNYLDKIGTDSSYFAQDDIGCDDINGEYTKAKAKKESSVLDEILSWVVFIVLAGTLAFVINSFILFNAHIPSASMENTIMAGDRVLGFRLTYTFSSPERYDVAIFIWPDSDPNAKRPDYYVKRVIGMPGETPEIRNGLVYINGSDTPLRDDFVKDVPYEENLGPFAIPEGSYFVMGDNRNNSNDSREWMTKYVTEDKMLAKAYVGIWPSPRIIK